MSETLALPPTLVPERPDFGCLDQLDANRVRPGVRILRHNLKFGARSLLEEITSMPYHDPEDRGWLAGTWWVDLDGRKSSLADMGVIPYQDGRWNGWNWTEVVA